jgi:hypothetical protein
MVDAWQSFVEIIYDFDPLSDGNNAIVACNDGVLKALIKIHTKFFFIQAQILQAILFDNRISIHNVLMPQSVTPK